MANRTVSTAVSVHGTNPQYLVDKIIRHRIYDSLYWKEHCFGLTVTGVMGKAADISSIGGCYGANDKPTEFLCLALKLLQLQPDRAIVDELINQEDFKYLRALAVFYLRLTESSIEIYRALEPLYKDYRKLRRRMSDGSYDLTHMDDFADSLLHESWVCNITLPRLSKRIALEDVGELSPRISPLDEDSDTDDAQPTRAVWKAKSKKKNNTAGRAATGAATSRGTAYSPPGLGGTEPAAV
ncbi:putative pre-mRNA splicing factor [Martensiomyces pterosporus]|nr:putative pre-mRNA splicing factor [Martensiomyces pterosporus]